MTKKISWPAGLAVWFMVAACLPSPAAFGADPDVRSLPGISGPDTMPNGCVSCHKGRTNLQAQLAALKHRDMEGKVAVVPQDCKGCHTPESGLETLSMIAHSMHYASGSSSDFIARHGGYCLHCHAMATGSGEVTVKQGPKNW